LRAENPAVASLEPAEATLEPALRGRKTAVASVEPVGATEENRVSDEISLGRGADHGVASVAHTGATLDSGGSRRGTTGFQSGASWIQWCAAVRHARHTWIHGAHDVIQRCAAGILAGDSWRHEAQRVIQRCATGILGGATAIQAGAERIRRGARCRNLCVRA
jgi:hypothetical protein